MSRFDGGWIKLHRKLGNHWISKDGYTLSIFVTLLKWANYKESKYVADGKLKVLLPGQVITSSRELSKQLQITRRTIEKRLALLEEDHTITQKVSHLGRIITICNWEQYQYEEHHQGATAGATASSTPGATASTLSEEVKKEIIKEVKKGTASLTPSELEVWNFYSEVYRKHYGVDKILTPGVAKEVRKILSEFGEHSLGVVELYLYANNKFYIRSKHAMKYILLDAEKLLSYYLQRKAAGLCVPPGQTKPQT